MTLANTQIFNGPFTAVPGQTTFAYTFKLFSDPTEIDVAVNSVFLLDSAYTVTGIGLPAGGTVVLNTPLVGGEQVVLIARHNPAQTLDFITGGVFPAESHEEALDRIMRLIQILVQFNSQSVRFGIDFFLASPPLVPVLPAPTAGALTFVPDTGGSGGAGTFIFDPINEEVPANPAAAAVLWFNPVTGEREWLTDPIVDAVLTKIGNELFWLPGGTGGGTTLPDQTGHTGKLLTTNGLGALSWQLFEFFLPQPLVEGNVLGVVSGNVVWTPQSGGGGSLPTQTGQAGNLLTTNGTAASWSNIINHLPTLVNNFVLANISGALVWVQQPTPGTTLPDQTGHTGKLLTTNGLGALSWQLFHTFLPQPLVAGALLKVNPGGTDVLWSVEIPPNPAVNSLLRWNQGGLTREWIPQSTFQIPFIIASSFTAGATDTINLQAALSAAASGTLIIDIGYTVTGVNVFSNTTIFIQPGVIIDAGIGQPIDTGIFNVHDVSNVVIYGNGARVDGNFIAPGTTDRGGLDIAGSTNITVRDLIIHRVNGDAISIGPTRAAGALVSRDIRVESCRIENNTRHNIHVRSVVGLVVDSVAMGFTNEGGLGIVPAGVAGHALESVVVRDLVTEGSTNAAGILIDLSPWNDSPNQIVGIDIGNHYSEGDLHGLQYLGMSSLAGTTQGMVRYVDGRVVRPLSSGITIEGTAVNGPLTEIIRPEVIDPNTSDSLDLHRRTGIFVGVVAGNPGAAIAGNVVIEGATVTDAQNPAHTGTLILAQNTVTLTDIQNVHVINPRRLDWIQDGTQQNHNRLFMSVRDGSTVTDDLRQLLYTAPADLLINPAGQVATWSNEGLGVRRTYTLANTATNDGLDLRFELQGSSPLRVQTSGGRIIGGGVGNWIESREPGAKLTLRPTAANTFEIVERVGAWGFESEFAEIAPLSVTGTIAETTLFERVFGANAFAVGDEADMLIAGTIEDGTGVHEFRFRVNGVEILGDNSNSAESWEIEASFLVISTTAAVARVVIRTRADRERHEALEQVISLAGTNTLAISVENSSAVAIVTRRIATCRLTSNQFV